MNLKYFTYKNDILHAENISIINLVKKFGTPLYIYSYNSILNNWKKYIKSCKNKNIKIYISVKANSNIAILNTFANLNSNFDIVSGGELIRVLLAGGKAKNIIFSGVGKSEEEMHSALIAGIKCFNIESIEELKQLNDIACKIKKIAPISIRINPNIDPQTHKYISTGLKHNKFGISFDEAYHAYSIAKNMKNLKIIGINCHIGSQITKIDPYLKTIDKIIPFIIKIKKKNIPISHINLGGGLGIIYNKETPPKINNFIEKIYNQITKYKVNNLKIFLEPGRSLFGNSGILITRIEFIKKTKEKNFLIVNAAMNDIPRPSIYNSYHKIKPIILRYGKKTEYDIVGPICESGDWLGKNRYLNVISKDLLAIYSAGAYCSIMSSNYNTRTRSAEIIVYKNKCFLIKKRETITDILKNEIFLPNKL